MVEFSNGWFRCSFTAAASTADRVVIGLGNDDTYSFAGDGSSGIFLWGAMIEEKSFSTSYIATTGSTVTRAAETCDSAGNSTVFNDSEGVLYAELEFVNDTNSKLISINDNSASNRILFGNFSDGNFKVFSQSSDLIVVSGLNGNNKIAAKYKSGDFSLFVNGVEVGTSTSTILPTGLTQLSFDNGASGSIFYGKVKNIQVYNTALTDAELIELTS